MRNIVYAIESVLYNTVLKVLWWRRPKYHKEYRVSAVTIFKDEARFLSEWLEYHIMTGFDHFYMYNNNSTDDYENVLRPYIQNGIVTLIQWPQEHGQIAAYQHFYENYRSRTQWIAFLDMDEFVVPRYKTDINEWIKNYEKYPSILVYWKMFGTSGKMHHDDHRLTIEQYTVCHDGFATHWGKCFVNTDYDIAFFNDTVNHRAIVLGNFMGFKIKIQPVNQFKRFVVSQYHLSWLGEKKPSIQINHYWSKAWDVYDIKRNRSDATFKENPRRNMSYFYHDEHRCITSDYSIFRFLMQLKLQMKEKGLYPLDKKN